MIDNWLLHFMVTAQQSEPIYPYSSKLNIKVLPNLLQKVVCICKCEIPFAPQNGMY